MSTRPSIGGLFYWQTTQSEPAEQAPKAAIEPTISASTSGLTLNAQPTPKITEADLLNAAFRVTIAKQGVRFEPNQLVQVGENTYAVIATAEGGEAHSDGGTFAVQYAKRTGNSFAPVGPMREIRTGSFGQVPSFLVRNDLGQNPIIVVEGGGTFQGCTTSTATLVELDPESPQELLTIPISYEYENEDGKMREYQGKIEMGMSGMQVRYSGSVEASIALIKTGNSLVPQSTLPLSC